MSGVRQHLLVLSLYLNARGLSFVLFEGTLYPYDWAVIELRGAQKDAQIMMKVTDLLHRYSPDALVVQDMGTNGTPRAARLASLNRAIRALAHDLKIGLFSYSRAEVYSTFQPMGFANKQMLAALIAKHIPAFERHVPPPRKPWMSEDARMGLFDAAALGLLFFKKAGITKIGK
jgi:hypothetical protein